MDLFCIMCASCVHHVCIMCVYDIFLKTCCSNGNGWCDGQCNDHAGLLSCQAHMHQPWQGSSRLTVPALQAWVIVVTMMEDEDSEVSSHVFLLCVKSVEPCSRQPQAIGRQPQQNAGQLVLHQAQLYSNSSKANLKEAYGLSFSV